jgi:hypothetical protein
MPKLSDYFNETFSKNNKDMINVFLKRLTDEPYTVSDLLEQMKDEKYKKLCT